MQEKERINNPIEELDTLLATLKKTIEGQVKTIEIRKTCKDEKRKGLLDSGATNNVREVKINESLKGLVPIKVEIAFDSEVKADLFMNAGGTIVGPESTETTVSVHEATAAGYSFILKTKDEAIM